MRLLHLGCLALMLLAQLVGPSWSLQRIKVCTGVELKQALEDYCIRGRRDEGSSTNVGPYGVLMAPAEEDRGRHKRHRVGGRRGRRRRWRHRGRRVKRASRLAARDYSLKCCKEGCDINDEVLDTFC